MKTKKINDKPSTQIRESSLDVDGHRRINFILKKKLDEMKTKIASQILSK